ncbi:hypothetical protein VTK26DRAFT_4355 [Humicola hyalothermophila]
MTTTIACKQRLKLSAAGVDLIKWGLEGTFGTVEELPETKPHRELTNGNGEKKEEEEQKEEADEELTRDEVVATYLVMGCVMVRYRTSGEVELEWEGNMLNDGIADAVMAVLIGLESSPAAVKRSASKHSHSHSHSAPSDNTVTLPHRNLNASVAAEDRLERLMMFLEAQFGADHVFPIAEPKLPPTPPPLSPPAKNRLKQEEGSFPKKEEAASAGNTGTAAANQTDPKPKEGDDGGEAMDVSSPSSDNEDQADDAEAERNHLLSRQQQEEEERRRAELARLHKLGIPVPGVGIKVDKMEARVWLEGLEVESANRVFADRVRAVVERAVEVAAPLWG